MIFLIPSDWGGLGRGHPGLLQVRKSLEAPHSKLFLRHLTVSFLLLSVRFPAAAYAVVAGKAAILRTSAPKRRVVRWLSANDSQQYRECSTNRPPVFTKRCRRLVNDQ